VTAPGIRERMTGIARAETWRGDSRRYMGCARSVGEPPTEGPGGRDPLSAECERQRRAWGAGDNKVLPCQVARSAGERGAHRGSGDAQDRGVSGSRR